MDIYSSCVFQTEHTRGPQVPVYCSLSRFCLSLFSEDGVGSFVAGLFVCFVVVLRHGSSVQLYHVGDMMYAMRRRKV